MKAIWKGVTLAESDDTIAVEGRDYFPPNSVQRQYLEESTTHTTCSWKGEASYYHVVVKGEKNRDAAWFYPSPKEEASIIKDYVAFWKGVEIAP